jgi:hypothetical protein
MLLMTTNGGFCYGGLSLDGEGGLSSEKKLDGNNWVQRTIDFNVSDKQQMSGSGDQHN